MTILLEVLITACLNFLLPVHSAPEEKIEEVHELVIHQKEMTKAEECCYTHYFSVTVE